MVGRDQETFSSLQRVHYFDGQMLTARDFQDEQAYHLEKRWLHNRLFHGSGVVTGLEVGEAGGTNVLVQPGVALDRFGREIIVPEARRSDAAQPTDDQGEPAGARLTEGTVSLLLRYREVGVEPRPLPSNGEEVPGRIAETYVLKVAVDRPADPNEDVLLAMIRVRGTVIEIRHPRRRRKDGESDQAG
jgi:hypothetical protein